MTWEGEERRSRSTWEKHAQTVILAVVVGLITWVGVTVTRLGESVVRLDERMTHLTDTVKELRVDRYTRTDADRDMGRIGKRVEDIDGRVQRLEGRR